MKNNLLVVEAVDQSSNRFWFLVSNLPNTALVVLFEFNLSLRLECEILRHFAACRIVQFYSSASDSTSQEAFCVVHIRIASLFIVPTRKRKIRIARGNSDHSFCFSVRSRELNYFMIITKVVLRGSLE